MKFLGSQGFEATDYILCNAEEIPEYVERFTKGVVDNSPWLKRGDSRF